MLFQIYFIKFSYIQSVVYMKQQTQSQHQYPPNITKSIKHRLANRIFKNQNQNQKQQQICQCCERTIGQENVQMKCCGDTDQLAFLGPGVPLYFYYLKSMIIMLILMSLVFSGYNMYANWTTQDCSRQTTCENDYFNRLSIVNKKLSILQLSIQAYISLSFIVVMILFLHYMRYKGRLLKKQCDQVVDSPSDYAIILRRLPLGCTEKDIYDMIEAVKSTISSEDLARTQNLKIIKVIMSYSLREYNAVKNRNAQNFKKFIKQNKIEQFAKMMEPLPNLNETSTMAIIVFQHQLSKSLILKSPPLCDKMGLFFCSSCLPLSQFKVKEERVSIQRAPQPDDILWQNSGVTMKGSIIRKLLYGLISMIILLLGGGAQYGLQLLLSQSPSQTTKQILQILISLLVIIFNSIIMLTLQLTTMKQRNTTLTQYQTVLTIKQTIFQFFNAGIFVIGSQIAIKINSFDINKGICKQIVFIMIFNAVIPNLVLIVFNYTQIVKKLRIFMVQKNIIIASQLELNQLYCGPNIDLPAKYSYIVKTIWLTGLYASITPVVVPISALGLAINYLFQKILFFRAYSMPHNISSMMFQSAVQLIQYFLITFSLGHVIIYLYFSNYNLAPIPIEVVITLFISLALSILNSMIPMQTINQSIFPILQSTKTGIKYSQLHQSFQVTYEMLNPAYKQTRKRKPINQLTFINIFFKKQQKNMNNELQNSNRLFYDHLLDRNQDNNENTNNNNPLSLLMGISQRQSKNKIDGNHNMKTNPSIQIIEEQDIARCSCRIWHLSRGRMEQFHQQVEENEIAKYKVQQTKNKLKRVAQLHIDACEQIQPNYPKQSKATISQQQHKYNCINPKQQKNNININNIKPYNKDFKINQNLNISSNNHHRHLNLIDNENISQNNHLQLKNNQMMSSKDKKDNIQLQDGYNVGKVGVIVSNNKNNNVQIELQSNHHRQKGQVVQLKNIQNENISKQSLTQGNLNGKTHHLAFQIQNKQLKSSNIALQPSINHLKTNLQTSEKNHLQKSTIIQQIPHMSSSPYINNDKQHQYNLIKTQPKTLLSENQSAHHHSQTNGLFICPELSASQNLNEVSVKKAAKLPRFVQKLLKEQLLTSKKAQQVNMPDKGKELQHPPKAQRWISEINVSQIRKQHDFQQKPLNNQQYLKSVNRNIKKASKTNKKHGKQQEEAENKEFQKISYDIQKIQIRQQLSKKQAKMIDTVDKYKQQHPFRLIKQFQDEHKQKYSIYNPFGQSEATSALEPTEVKPKYLKPFEVKKYLGNTFSSLLKQMEDRQQRLLNNQSK